MNIFGIGLPELAVIAAIALLVFGPKRLPEMGRSLGRTLRGFQSASQEFEKAFRDGLQPEDVQANPAQLASPPDATTATPTAVVASPE
ncbi:MAG: TatA/E family twin arginine-targeting protein translocase, partial [Cyanobium sp.]